MMTLLAAPAVVGTVPVATTFDIAFVVLFAGVVTAFEAFVFFPRFKAAIAAGIPDARVAAYRRAIIGQWIFAVLALVLWSRAGRPWTLLGLVPTSSYGRIALS